jgi:hypothetical protein
MGRNGEAEAAFRQAVALDPDFTEAHYQLGILLRETRRFAEAEAHLPVRRGDRLRGWAYRIRTSMCKEKIHPFEHSAVFGITSTDPGRLLSQENYVIMFSCRT